MEDLPLQIWRGTFLPYAAGACHRSGPVDRLRHHEQVATAHRDQCCRAPTDIVLDRNEVEIRSCAHERLILPPWWEAAARTYRQRDMLQALLADRLKLKIRHESRDFPVFLLVVDKQGLKLH